MNKKDYIRNKFAAEELADTVRDWWHRRGYTAVKVWVEEDSPISPYGTKLPSNYAVRSNILMNATKISQGVTIS